MREYVGKVGLFLGLVFFLFLPSLWAASSVPARSKPEAAMKGYLYETSHDEIVSKAKKEGSLRALLGSDPSSRAAIKEAFGKKYPFISGYFEEISGTDATERFLMELRSGRMADWDAIYLEVDHYTKLQPYVEKIDILSMARQKVLTIPTAMIDLRSAMP